LPRSCSVGQALEEQDALDQLVGVLHLVDRLVILVLAELLQPPVLVHARVQEVLVDGHQLVAEDLVQVLDDLLVAFHDRSCRVAVRLVTSNLLPQFAACQT